MNKNVKIILGIVLVILLLGGLFFLSSLAENKNFKKINYNEYLNLSSSNGNYVVFIGNESSDSLKSLKSFTSENNVKIRYIDSSSLTEEEKKAILDKDETEKLIFINNGKEEIYKKDFSKFSLTNEFINQNILDNTLVEVDIDNYLKLIKSKGNHIVFIGRETCSWCQKFKPNMKSAAKDYNITLYYIDTDKFIGEDWNKFKESEKYLTENEWGTPLTLLYKDGKLIDVLNGYVEETGIYEFLLKNGVIK